MLSRGELAVADGKVAHPAGIVGIGGGQATADTETSFILLHGRSEIAASLLNKTDACMADAEIVLPTDVAGIGGGEAADDASFRVVRLQRPGEIAQLPESVADVLMRSEERRVGKE